MLHQGWLDHNHGNKLDLADRVLALAASLVLHMDFRPELLHLQPHHAQSALVDQQWQPQAFKTFVDVLYIYIIFEIKLCSKEFVRIN
jgi:hypothetical protein